MDSLITLIVIISVFLVFFLRMMNKSPGELVKEIREALRKDEEIL